MWPNGTPASARNGSASRHTRALLPDASSAIGLFTGGSPVEQTLDLFFVSIFPRQPGMNRGDSALRVDEQSCGKRIQSAVETRHVVVAKHYTVIDSLALYEWLNRFPAILIQSHAQNHQAPVSI